MVYRLAIVVPPPPHFGWPKMNFDRTSRHFKQYATLIFFTKWLPMAILDGQSHFSAFQINTQFFILFTKWLTATILDDRKSLSIAFLVNSDQYATFFSQNGWRRPFWMTENHFRSHFSTFQTNTQLLLFWFFSQNFSPFQINTQLVFFSTKWLPAGHFGWPKITFSPLSRHFRSIRNSFFLIFFSKWPPAAILEVPFGPFWMTENHFWSHFSPFQINTQLFILFFSKWPPAICAKNNRVLPLCVFNGYAKYEVDRWICDTVRDATSFLSIFIQNGRQRPFCFSDWWQKS